MTITLMQVAVLPRASLVANIRSLHIDVPKSWNGSFFRCESSFFNGGKQGNREVRRRRVDVRAGKAAIVVKEVTDEDFDKQVQPSDLHLVAAIRSSYNYITVMEVSEEADHLLAGARLLFLDNPGCIHSVYYEHNALTNSYYDALATVIPLLPPGPVGILGLGAGSTSHVLRHFFPTIETHGWELDPVIISVARRYFNLSALEENGGEAGGEAEDTGKLTGFVDVDVVDEAKLSGKLTVHVGDAMGPDVCVEGGFAGLIVDLFAEGRAIPALQESRTWEQLKAKLKPGGRIIVNCGGYRVTAEEESIKSPGQLYMEQTVAAMREVFAGELSTRYLARKGFNTVALTGPFPDLGMWSNALPEPLRDCITDWKPVL